MPTPPLREIERRTFEEPRPVEVFRDGTWWPGRQLSWLLVDDGRGWVGAVRYSVRYEWGVGQHVGHVPADRLRLRQEPACRHSYAMGNCTHGVRCTHSVRGTHSTHRHG